AGVNITPAAAVFTVADPDHLEFEAIIDEVDIGLIKLSQSARLTLDAYPDETINLTIDSINFNSSLDSSGRSHYYRTEKANVLAVPLSSILENGTATVQLVKDNTLINQTVALGISSDDLVEITSGLSENQTIVVSKKSK
ncbi:HlyD family efflux transporter periplasmic adaptor subunit, partial [Patescibacteria group bacterium]|nr:HlyD family efflux transporter periplasmic adaptor subunit [Patescibacteria group bacterium]